MSSFRGGMGLSMRRTALCACYCTRGLVPVEWFDKRNQGACVNAKDSRPLLACKVYEHNHQTLFPQHRIGRVTALGLVVLRKRLSGGSLVDLRGKKGAHNSSSTCPEELRIFTQPPHRLPRTSPGTQDLQVAASSNILLGSKCYGHGKIAKMVLRTYTQPGRGFI